MRATVALVAPAVAVLVLAGCSGDDGEGPVASAPPTTVGEPAEVSVYDLATGDCFRGLGRNQDVRVRRAPCRGRHQGEVYGMLVFTERRFPGAEVLRREAATDCAQRFAGYTGEPSGPGTEVAFTEVVPTLQSWAAGDRAALCIALGLEGAPLEGTIAAGQGST